MNKELTHGLPAMLAIALMAGCQAYPETEADFGNSVRQMVRNQRVPTGPVDASPVEGADGQRIEAVIQTYRENVSQPQEVDDPVTFVGGTTQ